MFFCVITANQRQHKVHPKKYPSKGSGMSDNGSVNESQNGSVQSRFTNKPSHAHEHKTNTASTIVVTDADGSVLMVPSEAGVSIPEDDDDVEMNMIGANGSAGMRGDEMSGGGASNGAASH